MGPKLNKEKGSCGFCHQREQTEESGRLYKTPDDEVAAHLNCMLFSPLLVTSSTPVDEDNFEGFLLEDVKKEIKRGRRLKCSSCKQTGGTIGCDVVKCKKTYHYLCAKKCGAEIVENENDGIYKIFCARHRTDRAVNEDDSSNGGCPTTDDDLVMDDDDGTCDDDSDSLRVMKNKGEILDTPKRPCSDAKVNTAIGNMLKRLKTSTPHVHLSNGGCRQLDLSGADAVPGPSDAPRDQSKSQVGKRNLDSIVSSISKRKRVRCISNSSESSSSILVERPGKICQTERSAVIDKVENSVPDWIGFLSKYHDYTKAQTVDGGQTNKTKAEDFWKLSNDANCTEALFQKMKQFLENSMQHIQSRNVSEEGYEQSLQVLLASGCLQTIARDVKQEITSKKEALEKERANLLQKEQLLEEILPTLNSFIASGDLESSSEIATRESP